MQPWKQIGRYGTVGLELVLSMAIGYWIGHWADGKLGTKFCALIGLLVGVYAGFRNLMKAASFMQKEADREAEEELRKGPELLARAEELHSSTPSSPTTAAAGRASDPPKAVAGSVAAPSAPVATSTSTSTSDQAINAKGTGRGDAPS